MKTQVKIMRRLLSNYQAPKTAAAANPAESPPMAPSALQQELQKTYRVLDRAVSAGVIHANQSGRLKSRLTRVVNRILSA